MEAEAPADERDGRREVSFYRRSGLGYYSLRLRNSRGPAARTFRSQTESLGCRPLDLKHPFCLALTPGSADWTCFRPGPIVQAPTRFTLNLQEPTRIPVISLTCETRGGTSVQFTLKTSGGTPLSPRTGRRNRGASDELKFNKPHAYTILEEFSGRNPARVWGGFHTSSGAARRFNLVFPSIGGSDHRLAPSSDRTSSIGLLEHNDGERHLLQSSLHQLTLKMPTWDP